MVNLILEIISVALYGQLNQTLVSLFNYPCNLFMKEELVKEDEVGNALITFSHQNLTLVRLINTDVYDE